MRRSSRRPLDPSSLLGRAARRACMRSGRREGSVPGRGSRARRRCSASRTRRSAGRRGSRSGAVEAPIGYAPKSRRGWPRSAIWKNPSESTTPKATRDPTFGAQKPRQSVTKRLGGRGRPDERPIVRIRQPSAVDVGEHAVELTGRPVVGGVLLRCGAGVRRGRCRLRLLGLGRRGRRDAGRGRLAPPKGVHDREATDQEDEADDHRCSEPASVHGLIVASSCSRRARMRWPAR